MQLSIRAVCVSSIASVGLLSSLVSATQPPAGIRRPTRSGNAQLSHEGTLILPKARDYLCGQLPRLRLEAPKANIWSGITDDESARVTAWLFEQQDLNLTAHESATSWDNTIDSVQLLTPNKTDALAYIDGDGPEPPRYARVSLSLAATESPTYSEIMVGPLPIDESTMWQPLAYPYSAKRGGSIRNIQADDTRLYVDWLAVIGANISDITMDLWNKSATGAAEDTLLIYGVDPTWQDNERLIRWDTFWAVPDDGFDSISLLPQGLFIKSDVTGRDPSKWKVEGFLYDDIFYPSEDEFRDAFFSEGFRKLPPNIGGAWTTTDRQGPQPPLDALRSPLQVSPQGARYSIDHGQKYVQWLDWKFFVSVDRATGVGLFDVRHKDERILYELAMQEALAHYAGGDPVTSGIAFLDSYDSFAINSRPLIPGYDCPQHASYMNISYYQSDALRTNANAICLFESDTDHPIARHTAAGYVAATRNTKFVLRWIATIRNYDYLFSYEFYIDGSMQIKLQASGYISAAYPSSEDRVYGYRVHDQASGAPHDHVINFKADFDILGQRNSLQLAEFVPVTKNYVWSGGPRKTFHVERSFLESENEGRMHWSTRGATQYNVVNTDHVNRFGEFRGYRIAASGPTAHLTSPESSNLHETIHPFTFDLAVTRRKDEEPRSAHHYNALDVREPMVNFDEFFDGEGLIQEDLVLWFNLGMHHLPSSADIPNTLFNIAHTSVQIIPVNFHDRDPTLETAHRVRIDLNATTGAVDLVELFGQESGTCEVVVEDQLGALYGYGQA